MKKVWIFIIAAVLILLLCGLVIFLCVANRTYDSVTISSKELEPYKESQYYDRDNAVIKLYMLDLSEQVEKGASIEEMIEACEEQNKIVYMILKNGADNDPDKMFATDDQGVFIKISENKITENALVFKKGTTNELLDPRVIIYEAQMYRNQGVYTQCPVNNEDEYTKVDTIYCLYDEVSQCPYIYYSIGEDESVSMIYNDVGVYYFTVTLEEFYHYVKTGEAPGILDGTTH